MISARPLLGFGWSRFQATSGPYFRQSQNYPLTATTIDIHNYFLSYAVELGLIGLLIWLAGVLMGGFGALSTRAPPELEPWRMAFLAIAVCFLLVANSVPPTVFQNEVILALGWRALELPWGGTSRHGTSVVQRSFFRDIARLGTINRGARHRCPICPRPFAGSCDEGSIRRVGSAGDRMRPPLLMLCIQREPDLLRTLRRVPHVAPEPWTPPFNGCRRWTTPRVIVGTSPTCTLRLMLGSFRWRGHFEAVVCSQVLDHLPSHVRVAHEMAPVLTGDGVALIQVPVGPNPGDDLQNVGPLPADRKREYVQHDHVRINPPDTRDRLGHASEPEEQTRRRS